MILADAEDVQNILEDFKFLYMHILVDNVECLEGFKEWLPKHIKHPLFDVMTKATFLVCYMK